MRQRHFCRPGTGRVFGTDCVPKLTPFDFMMSDSDSIWNSAFLYDGIQLTDGDAAVGTDANVCTAQRTQTPVVQLRVCPPTSPVC